jgi:hypothetical protein
MNMTNDRGPRRLADEVRAAKRINAANRDPLVEPYPPDAVVLPIPPELFRPPAFLSKTAPADLRAELLDLLQELRTLNEEHEGEKVLEVAVYYGVTGLKGELKERLRGWGERYFAHRATPDHLNPAVRNDPFLLFEKRVLSELEQVFRGLGRRPNAVPPILQIDLSRLGGADRADLQDDEALQEAIAAACQTLANEDTAPPPQQEPPPAGGRLRLPSLRSNVLFRTMEKFGCEVRPGKGSEVVISRPGVAAFTVGRHKRLFEVHAVQVQRMLKRLKNSVSEWLTAVSGTF